MREIDVHKSNGNSKQIWMGMGWEYQKERRDNLVTIKQSLSTVCCNLAIWNTLFDVSPIRGALRGCTNVFFSVSSES